MLAVDKYDQAYVDECERRMKAQLVAYERLVAGIGANKFFGRASGACGVRALLRAYLLGHMVWMISDDPGILPRHARAAGFVQEGHGIFKGPSRYGHVSPEDVADLRELFLHDEKLPFFA